MALYWTFRSLPELNHLSERERRHVLRTSAGASAYFHLIRTALFYGFATTALSVAFLTSFMPRETAWIIGGCIGVLMLAASYQFCMRIIRHDLRTMLVKAYRGERLPVCLACGYDLKGIDSDTCPECGKGIIVQAKPKGNSETDDAV